MSSDNTIHPFINLLEEYLGFAGALHGIELRNDVFNIRLLKAVRDELLASGISPTPIIRKIYIDIFLEDPFPHSRPELRLV